MSIPLIVDRCNLGALPGKFCSIEQTPPVDWTQVPPALVHCTTRRVDGGIASRSKSLLAYNCEPGWTRTFEWSKGGLPEEAGDDEGWKDFHDGAPETIRVTVTREQTGGLVVDFYDEQSSGECRLVSNVSPDDPFGYFVFTVPSNPLLVVGGAPAGFTGSASGWSLAWPVEYSVADYEMTWHNGDPPPAIPKPDLSQMDWSGGLRVTGYQPDPESLGTAEGGSNGWQGESLRTAGEWRLALAADNIYSEEDWPLAEGGGKAVLRGAVRWVMRTETSTGDGPADIEETTGSDAFSLAQGEVWEGPLRSLDEAGAPGVWVTHIVNPSYALDAYPPAAMRDPDYSGFPYAAGG